MKVLVTGASGFVAPFLIKELKRSGFSVAATSMTAFHRCDLTDAGAVRRLLLKIRPPMVVHLAGLSQTDEKKFTPNDYFEANVVTTFNLVSALSSLSGKKTFLYVSSGMIYARGKGRTV